MARNSIAVDFKIGVQGTAVKAKQALSGISGSIKKAGAGMKRLNDLTGGLLAPLTALGSVQAIKSIVIDTLELSKALRLTAERTNVTVHQMDALRKVAKGVGVDMDDVRDLLSETAVKARDATLGSKGLQETFDRLGVSLTDVNGQLRSEDELLRDVATALATMENRTEAAAIADELWSDVGYKMLPVMDQVASAMDTKNTALGNLALKQEEASQTFAQFRQVMEDMRVAVTSALLPVIKEMADGFLRLKDYMAENEWVGQSLRAGLVALAAPVWGLVEAFEQLAIWIKGLSKAWDAFWSGDFAGAINAVKDTANQSANAAKGAIDDMGRAIKFIEGDQQKLNQTVGEGTDQHRKTGDEINRTREATKQLAGSQRKQNQQIDEGFRRILKAKEATGQLTKATQTQNQKVTSGNSLIQQGANTLRNQAIPAQNDLTTKVRDTNTAQNTVANTVRNQVASAHRNLNRGIRDNVTMTRNFVQQTNNLRPSVNNITNAVRNMKSGWQSANSSAQQLNRTAQNVASNARQAASELRAAEQAASRAEAAERRAINAHNRRNQGAHNKGNRKSHSSGNSGRGGNSGKSGNNVSKVINNLGNAIRGLFSANAEGGVVTRPTYTLSGEAGPEAIIPLSRGRSVPVEFQGTSGAPAGVTVTVQQYNTFTGAGTQDEMGSMEKRLETIAEQAVRRGLVRAGI